MNEVFNHEYKLDIGNVFDGELAKKEKDCIVSDNLDKHN
jgi:hypothetical protein